MRYNPFNPQQPARPDFFVGRLPEITQFEKFLIQTKSSSPMNMAITANRGMGKTSIIIKFEEIAKGENCLAIRLSNYEGNVCNIIDFSDFLSSNIKTELLSKKSFEGRMQDVFTWAKSLKPQIQWKDIKLTIEKKQLIQKIFSDRLVKLWVDIKKDFDACVILIDEAESLEKIEGVFQFLREAFQRISNEANYMIILAGKLNFPERMSEEFSPLNRFFPAHKLEAFSKEEIETYIKRKLETENTAINKEAIEIISQKSEGHPYVLVSMSYIIFDSLNKDENVITKDVVNRALPKINYELAKDFFAPMHHPLTPKAKEVLYKIAINIENLDFSFREACNWTKMERNYVSPYIQELLRKGILNKPERGQYQFFHKLFIEYVKDLGIKTPSYL
jgi:hypothetical protein